jgi:hypothetical protein
VYVALNTNTPVKSLDKLARDSDKGVRFTTYRNPSTPIEILKNAAKDRNVGLGPREELMKIIRQREATNESLLRSLIRRIV